MRRSWIAASMMVLAAAPVLAKPGDKPMRAKEPANDRTWIVVFDDAALADVHSDRGVAIGSLAHQLAGNHQGRVKHVLRHALTGAILELASEKQAERLAEHPAVRLVEENGIVHASARKRSTPAWERSRSSASTPEGLKKTARIWRPCSSARSTADASGFRNRMR